MDYERDRLQSVGETLLSLNGLNWFDAARLIRPIEKPGSVLLIGAALEEFARDRYEKGRLPDHPPASPPELNVAVFQLRAAGKGKNDG